MRQKAYIAFSIHGTCAFIVATKIIEVFGRTIVTKPPSGIFSKVESRRPNAAIDDLKLHWDKLNKADGTPHTNPSWVIRRFNELEKAGWIIDRKKFIQRNKKNGKDHAVSRR